MKNNKFTDGKTGDKGGEVKKQAKGNKTEASKQDDCSSDEQRGKFQRFEEHGLHRD